MFKNKHMNDPNLAKVLPVLCLGLSIILSSYSEEFIFPGKFIQITKASHGNFALPWTLLHIKLQFITLSLQVRPRLNVELFVKRTKL